MAASCQGLGDHSDLGDLGLGDHSGSGSERNGSGELSGSGLGHRNGLGCSGKLSGLGDDLVIALFACAPYTAHGNIRAVCRRLGRLLKSRAFREQRLASGYAEHGVVVAGGERDDETRTAECWLLAGGRSWRTAPLSGARYSACSAVVDHEMWVFGGRNDVAVLKSVEAFDARTQCWRPCPPMLERRSGAVAGVVGGSIVVAGGACSGRTLASAEAYQPSLDAATGPEGEWTALPPLPHAAWLATAAVLDGVLLVAGGVRCDKLRAWDGAAWRVRSDLPAKRWGAAGVATEDGKLALIGGSLVQEGASVQFQDTASVITYDPREDAWETTTIAPLPEPRTNFRATIEHGTGSILVAGGGGPPLRYSRSARAWYEVCVSTAAAGFGSDSVVVASGAVCEAALLG